MKDLQRVQADEKPLSTADIFLVFGEKVLELEMAGLVPFFFYFGHLGMFQFRIFNVPFEPTQPPVFSSECLDSDNLGEFIEKSFHAANLAILAQAAFDENVAKSCGL